MTDRLVSQQDTATTQPIVASALRKSRGRRASRVDPMFGGPVTGALMNPMRSLGPALVSGNLHALWLYIVAPVLGASLGGIAYQFVRGEAVDAAEDAS